MNTFQKWAVRFCVAFTVLSIAAVVVLVSIGVAVFNGQ